MHLALRLFEAGVITAEQLVTTIQAQMASRPQIGALAVEAGKLTIKEVFSILRAQADHPERLFGELAVEAGMIEEDDLATLIYRQSMAGASVADLVVELGFASREQVAQHLEDRPPSVVAAQSPAFSVAG